MQRDFLSLIFFISYDYVFCKKVCNEATIPTKGRGEAPREKNNGAFSNRHRAQLISRYFDNGPLESRVVPNITFRNLA